MEKNIVVINKKIASNIQSLEVDGDIIVPDIKPDIISIINANANSYIYKEELIEGKIRIDGNIDTYIVYLADNGENRCIQTTLNFVQNIEDENITSKCFSKEKIEIENIEVKILNERKLSIKVILKVQSEVFENEEVEFNSDFEEIEEVQKLKENLQIKSIIGMNKVKTTVKEDISVDNSYEIAEILRTSIEVQKIENKISYNKVLAKAEAKIKIVFSAEDGRIGTAEGIIPIMSFIDIEKVTDTNECNTEYNIRNMLFKINSKENHSINCQIEFEVMCEVYENKEIEVIQDMYGIRKNIEFKKKEFTVQANKECPEQIINLNEKILVEDITNIIDTNSKFNIITVNKSGNFYNYECEMGLELYYEAENKAGLNSKKINIPFIVKFDKEEQLNFNINKKEFTINGEYVDIAMEISGIQINSNMKKVSIIEDVEIKDLEEENEYKMFLYFIKAGDTMWNIAKHFRVSMSEIIKLNNIEAPDKLQVGEGIYIMR